MPRIAAAIGPLADRQAAWQKRPVKMAISMSITRLDNRESKEIPVAMMSSFRSCWEPAAKELGLEMVQSLGGLWITPPFRDRFLNELAQLSAWARDQTSGDVYLPEMISRIDEIATAVRSHSLDDYEISFG